MNEVMTRVEELLSAYNEYVFLLVNAGSVDINEKGFLALLLAEERERVEREIQKQRTRMKED